VATSEWQETNSSCRFSKKETSQLEILIAIKAPRTRNLLSLSAGFFA